MFSNSLKTIKTMESFRSYDKLCVKSVILTLVYLFSGLG